MKERFFKTCMVIAITSFISGCFNSDSPQDTTKVELTENVKIGLAHCCDPSDVFMYNFYQRFQAAGSENPKIDLILKNANNDKAAQLKQVDQLIADGVQALLMTVVPGEDPGQVHHNAVLGKAEVAGIPVVLYVIHASYSTFKKHPNTYFVGSLAPQSGIYQGELIIKGWTENPQWDRNKDGIIQYAILKGTPGNPDAEARTKWVGATILNYPGKGIAAEQIDLVVGNWRFEEARQIVNKWLNSDAGKKIEVLIANNDDMALGAIEALNENNTTLPVFGVDAVPKALRHIQNGKMAATVQQDGTQQANEALNLAINLALGNPTSQNTEYKVVNRELMVPYIPIDKDNVQAFIK